MTGPAADGRPGDEALLEFAAVMRRLRAECPWKREQTHRSLQRYLLEETYETLEAIDGGAESGDWGHLREELGDLLLQVYFHAVIAEESGAFTLADVAAGITDKMRRRNQHVFGPDDGSAPVGGVGADGAAGAAPADRLTAEEVDALWQQAKEQERGRSSPAATDVSDLTTGIPAAMPALAWADKVAARAERAGRRLVEEGADHDRPGPGPDAAGPDAAGPDADGADGIGPDGIGEELLALVLRARAAGVDPEQELRRAVRRRAGGA